MAREVNLSITFDLSAQDEGKPKRGLAERYLARKSEAFPLFEDQLAYRLASNAQLPQY